MANSFSPDVDRLPWLTDDKSPNRSKRRWWLLPLALVGIGVLAAVSYWFGTTRGEPQDSAGPRNEVTTALPVPSPATSSIPDIQPAPMPEVQLPPVPSPVAMPQQREARIAAAQPKRRAAARVSRKSARRAPAQAAADASTERKTLQFSNPWESADASGRMVRVGTYSSLKQGKQAWSRLARVFPAMSKLPAVVTDIPSLRNGRVYYRLQIGTTSQAHSEVLCQRMKAIGQSCVVVDLAGARRGIGDERQPVGI